MKTHFVLILAVMAIGLIAQAQQQAALPSLELRDYIGPAPLGTAMETPAQKAQRDERAKAVIMRKIETLGLYAVAKVTVDQPCWVYRPSGRTEWTLERGETFPLLGFDGPHALVALGDSWIRVPRDAVEVFRLSDRPQAQDEYRKILAQSRADESAYRQEAQAAAAARAAERRAYVDSGNAQWAAQQAAAAAQAQAAELRRLADEVERLKRGGR